jgi:hypothetical protein
VTRVLAIHDRRSADALIGVTDETDLGALDPSTRCEVPPEGVCGAMHEAIRCQEASTIECGEHSLAG